MTVWISMPAYNEATRLPDLLARWGEVMGQLGRDHRYVLVDDGSTDETPEILRGFAAQQRVDIITHRPNQGLGVSLRDGLRFVAAHGVDDDVVVMMDADNTQPPELLATMLERMDATGCDVVIASRYRTGAEVVGVSAFRRLLSFGARVLFQVAFPIRGVRDYTCGYRLYRVAMIRRALERYGDRFCDRPGFECTADILLRLAKLGARFEEVGMVLQYDRKGGDSNMPVGRTVGKTLGLMLARRFERAEESRYG